MAGFFNRLKEGLTKTRNNIVNGIDSVFSGFSTIDEDFYEELEEILIMGDIGVNATEKILDRLRSQGFLTTGQLHHVLQLLSRRLCDDTNTSL